MYAFLDRVHPGALLHRQIGELVAEDIRVQLNGDHPTVPEKLDLSRGASAGYTVASWQAAGGQALPGYNDGSELDALLQRPVQGLVHRCAGSTC